MDKSSAGSICNIDDIEESVIFVNNDNSCNLTGLDLENISLYTNPNDYTKSHSIFDQTTIRNSSNVDVIEPRPFNSTIMTITDDDSIVILSEEEGEIVSVKKKRKRRNRRKTKKKKLEMGLVIINEVDEEGPTLKRVKIDDIGLSPIPKPATKREGTKPLGTISEEPGSGVSTSTLLPEVSIYSESNSFISDNMYHEDKFVKSGLRPVVIDGSNVAMGYTKGRYFCVKALKICIDYFIRKGHKVYAFVPSYRLKRRETDDQSLLRELVNQQLVFCTHSREVAGKKICSYDDRILVQVAAEMGAVIVSADNYRDLVAEDPRLIPIIEKRLLVPMWVGNMIVFPPDPIGRHGPKLAEFLRF